MLREKAVLLFSLFVRSASKKGIEFSLSLTCLLASASFSLLLSFLLSSFDGGDVIGGGLRQRSRSSILGSFVDRCLAANGRASIGSSRRSILFFSFSVFFFSLSLSVSRRRVWKDFESVVRALAPWSERRTKTADFFFFFHLSFSSSCSIAAASGATACTDLTFT